MNYKKIGLNIRQLRKEQNLTIEKLAEICNISPNFLGKIERAQSIPSIETLIAIANGLNVGVDILVEHELNAVNKRSIENLQLNLDLLDSTDKKTCLEICECISNYFAEKSK